MYVPILLLCNSRKIELGSSKHIGIKAFLSHYIHYEEEDVNFLMLLIEIYGYIAVSFYELHLYAVKEYSIIIILDVHTYTFLRFFKNLNVSKETVWPLFWDILVKAIENHAQKRLNNISKMLKFV